MVEFTLGGRAMAVEIALSMQQNEPDPGAGVGLAWGEDGERFVQWCRGENGDLATVEARFPPGDAQVERALAAAGLAPHSDEDLASLNIWEHPGDVYRDARSREEVAAVIDDLVALAGGPSDGHFEVYP